ncbi:MAG: monovalent cation/H(+) antiporter subunit G [Alphaproteobacteria bacterium]|nr:monovalent cation/H(+) antiporter subunit G [Alphaproteobacteria bacterium]
MVDVLQYVAGIAMLLGGGFALTAAIGLIRLPDLYTRMHAASKAGAMATGLMFLSIAVVAFDGSVILRAAIGFVFVLLTTPVSAHLLARASFLTGYRPADITKPIELDAKDIE